MATKADRAKQDVIEESLIDLRKIYGHVASNYDQLRSKALALIVAETAVISFIFSRDTSGDFGMPTDPDRKIFFFTAIVFFGLAFGILLWIISTVGWKLPHDLCSSDELVNRYRDKEGYLKHVHADYVKDIQHNIQVTGPKFKHFNTAVYLLSAAVIMILVIKYGGHRNDNKSSSIELRHGNSVIIKAE